MIYAVYIIHLMLVVGPILSTQFIYHWWCDLCGIYNYVIVGVMTYAIYIANILLVA